MLDSAKDLKLRLFINGKYVPLKPFLTNFVKQIILAMVLNLKDVEKPKKVELTLSKK